MTVDPFRSVEEANMPTLTTIGQPFAPPPGLYGPRVRWEIVTPSGEVVGLGVGNVGWFAKAVDPAGCVARHFALFGDGHPRADDGGHEPSLPPS